MSRADHALILLTLSVVGIWGCAQNQTPGPSTSERLRALEVKNAKLEDDFKAVASTRDQLRKRLASAEQSQQHLQAQLDDLQKVTKERDSLREQLTSRTAERDSLTTQLAHFRKGLKDLIGEVEAALPHESESVTTGVEEVVAPSKS
jgi:chromosome segregation ATPase